MPFGTELTGKDTCRFALWAPGADAVDLKLIENSSLGERLIPMERDPDGWYVVETAARPGTGYCYRIDNELCVPDPASRAQCEDVHGPSLIVDPTSWRWKDRHWQGRPWEEAIFYELHVGSFSQKGTFGGVQEKLDHLVDLGITAIELMPVADFPGKRNWGYDGVLPFAPDKRYGSPDELKALVEAAHAREVMVFLDVVYNHFGPEGNYLHLYAPSFFTERHHTPWGAAINFDGDERRWVREFYVHNALYWLEEFNFDGLRLDAVHAIEDDSRPDILEELADRVHAQFAGRRRVHLVLENDRNEAHYLRPLKVTGASYSAQWNDDIHHALHVITTDEETGYYVDYSDAPLDDLGRCLTEGFAFQGEASRFRGGARRGESTDGLKLTSFVGFLQNHDQVGNRAFGERITDLADETAIRAVTAIVLLCPSPPLLFMGQEWGTRQPFPFFCDFGPDLASEVTEGRRQEFARFPAFADAKTRERIPDPVAESTFDSARLAWSELDEETHHQWLAFHSELIQVRAQQLMPRLKLLRSQRLGFERFAENGLQVRWPFEDGTSWLMVANLGAESIADIQMPRGQVIYSLPREEDSWEGVVPGWGLRFLLLQDAGTGIRSL